MPARLADFLAAHGLVGDPFAQTDAEEEEFLADYFVPPPYFESVLGDPSAPKSTVVFAPRGGGKTAQRRMLEEDSRSSGAYLCVLYDRFPEAGSAGISVNEHLDQLCHRLLLGLLISLEERGAMGADLFPDDREFITNEAALLDSVDDEAFDVLLRSLKSDTRKMSDWMRAHSGPVKTVVAGLLRKRGIELDPTQPWAPQMMKAKETAPLARLARLIQVAQNLDFESVYVLIDRLDETPTTGTNPKKAIELVANLLLDLKVMGFPGLAIKVFAWDLSQDHYHELGGRRDRVKEFELVWGMDSLSEMMARRLQAYSDGAVDSLNQLLRDDVDVDLHKLAGYVAHSSPRDMIRFCGHVVAEHLNQPSQEPKIGEAEVWSGLRALAAEICDERGKKFLPDLMRLDRYRFTQNKVANDYLKISKQAVQAKVVEWRRTSMIAKVTEVQDARARPQHLYGVADPRLAVHLRPSESPRDVFEFFSFLCTYCSALNFSDDETDFVCIRCNRELTTSGTPSLMQLCTRPGA